ncbi:CaiB/BaiF CoA-transferase family protein [Halomonas sp. 3H]|jgi:crotonobetainyl-CoA:carnitine CoA-transferase CaiB-like acyl-CoA transferase|uniref:CaiB/BaiF CoA transferase family protein n=1 Tax=Halomonas sp. 3H TaxID=2952527 RepID=UPI0020B6D4CD|nr:CoA transferase [Halomonas sp. 3H]
MLPLERLKVLDVSQIMAGPYCTMVLGDMGAEVIKVEKINGGDDSRQMGPYVNDESTCFSQINRNKKSISLNLKDERAREIFYRLAREADVIVENYRPGVTTSLKIDYDSIRAINPGIIYCSISGYGQTGPYSHRGGFDLVAQGMTGLMSMTGEKGRRPLKTGVAVYDIGGGITAVYSILAAYIHRMATGEGQHIDIAITECGLPWFTWEAAAYFSEGKVPEPTGWRHRVSAPYQAVKARDGYLMLGCANQRTWERFCGDVLERPELMEEPRFLTNFDRGQHVEELEALLETIMADRDVDDWLARCDRAGVPAGPINDFAQAMSDEHYLARGMVQEMEHPVIGRMKTIGFPSKFSATPSQIRSPAPLFGQHTDEVLGDLGLPPDELATLRDAGCIK